MSNRYTTLINVLIASVIIGLLFAKSISVKAERRAERRPYLEYIGYVNEIRQAFAKEMIKELDLVPAGHSGMMHEKVEELGIEFNANRRATVEEARALQLFVMEKFVQAINGHEKIQPFLEERPFTYKRIMITIEFQGPNGSYADGSVDRIYNIPDFAVIENRNNLFYYSDDPFTWQSNSFLQEPYEEAVKLAKATPPQNLFFHQNTPMEEAFDQTLSSFSEEMLNKYYLKCRSIGGKMAHSIEDIGASFVLTQRATQEEARALELFVTERLVQVINENLKPYLSEYPFPTHRVKLRISFTDRRHFPYSDGSMERIVLEGDEITYFKEPPFIKGKSYPLKNPAFAKESYQEAMRIVENKPLPPKKWLNLVLSP